jgi:hypothetical protein
MEDGILMNVDPKSYNEVEEVEVDSSGEGADAKWTSVLRKKTSDKQRPCSMKCYDHSRQPSSGGRQASQAKASQW